MCAYAKVQSHGRRGGERSREVDGWTTRFLLRVSALGALWSRWFAMGRVARAVKVKGSRSAEKPRSAAADGALDPVLTLMPAPLSF